MNFIGMHSKAIWAKKSNDEQWLPLITHMADAAQTAKLLWHKWLPACTKRRITQGLNLALDNNSVDLEDAALSCFVFLAAAHDLGKAIPAFQGRLRGTDCDNQLRQQLMDVNLMLPGNIHPKVARHYWASHLILKRSGFNRRLAVILGSHHGKPPNDNQLEILGTYEMDMGWKKGQEPWETLQKELLQYALQLAGVTEQKAKSWQPDLASQVLLSGLVIMVDWIISNEDYFPYIYFWETVEPSTQRVFAAWDDLKLPQSWEADNAWEWLGEELYEKRFGILKPRPIQTSILKVLGNISAPGIVIIEAPMGEGKTEAALAAAEILANRTKRNGVFFALPTQATANGMFLRLCQWIEKLQDGVNHAVHLAHGKADLNELYKEIRIATKDMGSYWVGGEESEETDDDAIIVHEWFSGRKKGILAEFVMGTIDQVLMGGLKQKHLALRHLGLANKVVVLDECHAYDVYMNQYLFKTLQWLGVYGVPVIVLSATLPGTKRKQLIDAYLNSPPPKEYDPVFDKEKSEPQLSSDWATTNDYPIITFTDGDSVNQEKVCGNQRPLEVELQILTDDGQVIQLLQDLLSNGGCAGIIVNTVGRAQKIALDLSKVFGQDCIELLHSRFIAMERVHKEKELFEKLGVDGERPHSSIVVGTQIFEQSCDLDFDVLITDICPMDLLIQRIGRLHRHDRNRPEKLKSAQCYIIGMNENGFDSGAESIYGKYLLMNTRALITGKIKLPDDIPKLVQGAYHPGGLQIPEELQNEYEDARAKQEQKVDKKIAKAQTFQIRDPLKGLDDLVGWLDTDIKDDPSGKRGEASVRDIEDSIEVLVVQRRGYEYFMLPWLPKLNSRKIPTDAVPESELAQAIAECSIQLPRELCWKLDETIAALEEIALQELRIWQQSSWLKGELFLVLDEQFSTELCGVHLWYDRCYGLFSEKINKEGENAGEGI